MSANTTTFSYTGGVQTFTVPAGVTLVKVDARGGQGGGTFGGAAGRVVATLAVNPGDVLTIKVGGQPTGQTGAYGGSPGGNGGNGAGAGAGFGGGGGSTVDTASVARAIIAGGGGGFAPAAGGAYGAGGPSSTAGSGGGTLSGTPGGGGGGGTQSSAGLGGSAQVPSTSGVGGFGPVNSGAGGGGGTPVSSSSCSGGGGGGGGYYGGGGGGSGNGSNAAGGGGGGGSNFVTTSATSATVTDGYQSGNGVVTVTYYSPNAPTLTAPANASYADLGAGYTFTWTYNADPASSGQTQSAWALRQKISGAGSYQWWNSGTGAFQGTEVFNSGAAQTFTFAAGKWVDGNIYNWSVNTQDQGGTGSYATDSVVNAQIPPSLTVTTPTGTVITSAPTVTWADTIASGGSQTAYRVVIYSAAQYGAVGFSPGTSAGTVDSGVVASSATSYAVTGLTNATTYRAYVQITATGSVTSAWAFATFTVSFDAPAQPVLTATATTDGTTGAPVTTLGLQARDNLLSTNAASMETDVSPWTAGTSTAIAQSTALAPPLLRNTSKAASSSAASLALSVPTGVQNGDLMVVVITTTGNVSITPPGGWAAVRSDTTGATTADVLQAVYSRVAASEPASYTWTVSSAAALALACAAYSQAASLASSAGQANAASTTAAAPAYTPATENTKVLVAYGTDPQTTVTVPAGYTNETTQAAGAVLQQALDDELFAVPAATTPSATLGVSAKSVVQVLGVTAGGGVVALDGTATLRLQATAGASISAGTATGTSGVAVQPSTQYTALASFRTAVTGRSCTLTVKWYQASGAASGVRVSDTSGAVTDTTGGWTQASLTVTSPSDAAFAAITVTVASAANGEVHYVDCVDIGPGSSLVWTRGGLVGSTTALLQSSDDGGTTWKGVRNGTPSFPATTQLVTVSDYEAPPNATRQYRAYVTALV